MSQAGARALRDYEDRLQDSAEWEAERRRPRRLHMVPDAERGAATGGETPAIRARPSAGGVGGEAPYAAMGVEGARRTVTITGHPVPARRRIAPARSRVQARPDRIALWAFMLGLFLVFMAVATANAAAL